MYDASGGTEWASDVLTDAVFSLELRDSSGARSLKFEFVNDGMAVWSAEPVTSDANDSVLAIRVTGAVVVGTGAPFRFTLINDRDTVYA